MSGPALRKRGERDAGNPLDPAAVPAAPKVGVGLLVELEAKKTAWEALAAWSVPRGELGRKRQDGIDEGGLCRG